MQLEQVADEIREVARSPVQHTLPGFRLAPQAKPFLKWAGGKTRLLDAILPHVPARMAVFHEPFLGSGAVFFAVEHRIAGRAHLGDLNDQLINAWSQVRNDVRGLLDGLERYRGLDREEDYYEVREAAPADPLQRATRFVYLNQTAWNGLWRENKQGVFNVPWGDRPFRGLDVEATVAVSRVLRRAEIRQRDFRQALADAKAGDFVYLDPPYLPISDTSKFSGYTGKRFRLADLVDLSEACRELSERGVAWMMSNRDNARMRELFSHAKVIPFTTWRSVSAQNRRNVEPAASPEVIVVGGPT